MGRARSVPSLPELLIGEGQPEIGDVGLAGAIEEDVGGLDVPMHDFAEMGVVQGLGDDRDDFCGLPRRKGALLDPYPQVCSFDELRDHIAQPVRRPIRLKDRHDVGMVEAGQDLPFLKVEFDVLGPADHVGMRHLDRHQPLEHRIEPLVDRAEAPTAQNLLDAVLANLGGMDRGILCRRILPLARHIPG